VDDEAIDYAVSTVVIAACGRNCGGATTITEVERQFTIVA
jgi:hypothetical protein